MNVDKLSHLKKALTKLINAQKHSEKSNAVSGPDNPWANRAARKRDELAGEVRRLVIDALDIVVEGARECPSCGHSHDDHDEYGECQECNCPGWSG